MEDHNEPVMGYPVPHTFIITESNNQKYCCQSRCFKICCRIISALVILILFVIVIALFIAVFGLQPPLFEAKSTISKFNLTGSQLSAHWEIYLYVQNPNRLASITYQNIAVKISYNEFCLGNTIIDPFHQHGLANTTVQANMTSFSAPIDKSAAKEIARAKEDGFVGFSLGVDANISMDSATTGGKGKRKRMRVFCQEVYAVVIGKGVAGTAPYGAMDCSVHVDGL